MPVRSAELFTYLKTGSAVGEGPTARYTCPSGATVLLKYLVVSSFSAGAPAVIVYVKHGTPVPIIFMELAMPAASVQRHDMWIVLEPGDQIQTFVDLVNATDIVWIAAYGAILDGVA